MARITTNIEYDSYFWVDWSQVSQDTTANKTKIKWSYGVYCGHRFESNAIEGFVFWINGVEVYSGGTYSNFSRGDHTIASGTLDIPHGSDGKKTFNISSFKGWLYSNHNYTAGATSHKLPDIPRKATITASADFTDQDNPSITISNPGGFKMDVWLEPNPNGERLCVREDITLTDGKYTWAITDAEREELRNHCPGEDCTIRVGVDTHIGSEIYHDFHDKKFTMVESDATRPTVTLDASLVNGFEGMYIQGKSRVAVVVTGEGKYGSSISSLYATVDGKTYNSGSFTSDAIQGSGYVKIIGYAKDSREITGSAEETIYVHGYSKPLVVPIAGENAIQCYRSDNNGKRVGNSTTLWIKAGKSHHSIEGNNLCHLEWRWKPASRQWADSDKWDTLLAGEDGDEYNSKVPGIFVFDTKTAYTVQIRAIDYIGEYDIKTLDIPTQDVALHLGMGGKNVTVGTYCDYSEEYTFRSEWNAIFEGDVHLKGRIYVNGGQSLEDYIMELINGG